MSNITVKSSEARTRFRDLLDQVLAGKGESLAVDQPIVEFV